MRFLGIHIESKTDIIAFSALVISVIGLSSQFWDYIVGSQVTLTPPNQIIFKLNMSAQNKVFVDVISRQIYLNTGAPEYSEAVIREVAYIWIGDKKYRLKSLNTVSPQRDFDKLILTKKKDFIPFLIHGNSIKSHYTQFVSEPLDEAGQHLTKEEFISAVATSKKILYQITYEGMKGSHAKVLCEATTENLLRHIGDKEWSAIQCLTSSSGRKKPAA